MSLKEEITGICFQKVNEGIVRSVMENSAFSNVEWRNYPTRNNQVLNPLKTEVQGPVAQNDHWTRFSALMASLKQILIDQVGKVVKRMCQY